MERNIEAITYSIIKGTAKKNTYAEGKLGDFNVTIMKENGYINATKMCNMAGKSKRYVKWKENDKSIDFINFICEKYDIPIKTITIVITYDIGEVTGTYVHPRLIIQIASWCSAEFADKVTDIVFDYYAKQALQEKDKLLREQAGLLQEKDNDIAELKRMFNEFKEQASKDHKSLRQANEDLRKDTKNIRVDTQIIIKDNKKTHVKLDNMTKISKHIAKQRVIPPEKTNEEHCIVVIRLNNGKRYDTYVKRVQRRSINTSKLKKKNKNLDIFKIIPDPNPISQWGHIRRELLARKLIKTKRSTIRFRRDFDINQFVDAIIAIQNNKFKEIEIELANYGSDEDSESDDESYCGIGNSDETDIDDIRDNESNTESESDCVKKPSKKSTRRKPPSIRKYITIDTEDEIDTSDTDNESNSDDTYSKQCTKPKSITKSDGSKTKSKSITKSGGSKTKSKSGGSKSSKAKSYESKTKPKSKSNGSKSSKKKSVKEPSCSDTSTDVNSESDSEPDNNSTKKKSNRKTQKKSIFRK